MTINAKDAPSISNKKTFALYVTKTKQENGQVVQISFVKGGYTIIVTNTFWPTQVYGSRQITRTTVQFAGSFKEEKS